MRVYDQGCFFAVSVSPRELSDFADRWPCSGMRCASRGVTFTFDKRNGDLVDSTDNERFDGGATVALSQDAQEHGIKVLTKRAAKTWPRLTDDA